MLIDITHVAMRLSLPALSSIPPRMNPTKFEDVLATYREHGHRHYGENVTELEHALQCATFAQQAGEAPVVVAAALLHDYGHLCHQLGEDIAQRGVDARHECIGHEKLRHVFKDEIADACRLHVAAKRYLCHEETPYLDGLSDASRRSLVLQGGPMNGEEARAFEQEPHFALAVRVRRYDDIGKVPGMITPNLDDFVPLLKSFARSVLVVLLLFFTHGLRAETQEVAKAGKSQFTVTIHKQELNVFAYRPASFANGPLLVVMHGMKRNADTYRDHAVPLADRLGALVIAPEFDKPRFPVEAYQRGNVLKDGQPQPPESWTYDYVAKLIAEMRRREGRADMPGVLIGHSAGGQFLTRYAAFQPGDAMRIVAANPGSLIFPTRDMPFPYGFGGLPAALGDDDAIRRYLATPLTLFLGTADTLAVNLEVTPDAMKQGATRIERGRACYSLAKDVARKHGWPLAWRIVEAPGIGHDGGAMLGHPLAPAAIANPKGKLVIVGGGVTPKGLFEKMLGMAGGPEARVLVVSLAKAGGDTPVSHTGFEKAGAKHLSFLRDDDAAAALEAVRSAEVIWFGGGKQSLLMPALQKLGITDALRERYHAGAIVGGSSAGAAVMSQVMLMGADKTADGTLVPKIGEGLGLWPEAIVDQHFLKRSREPRLRAAVLAQRTLPGIGIDESTYVLVSGDELEVGGNSTVLVLDPRWGSDLQRFELRPGDHWHYRTQHE